MKRIYKATSMLGLLALLTGCAGAVPWNPQGYAGLAAYEIEPIITEAGVVACCRVWIRDGKEAQAISVDVSKSPNGAIHVTFDAVNVKAFKAFAERAALEKEMAISVGKALPGVVGSIVDSLASP